MVAVLRTYSTRHFFAKEPKVHVRALQIFANQYSQAPSVRMGYRVACVPVTHHNLGSADSDTDSRKKELAIYNLYNENSAYQQVRGLSCKTNPLPAANARCVGRLAPKL